MKNQNINSINNKDIKYKKKIFNYIFLFISVFLLIIIFAINSFTGQRYGTHSWHKKSLPLLYHAGFWTYDIEKTQVTFDWWNNFFILVVVIFLFTSLLLFYILWLTKSKFNKQYVLSNIGIATGIFLNIILFIIYCSNTFNSHQFTDDILENLLLKFNKRENKFILKPTWWWMLTFAVFSVLLSISPIVINYINFRNNKKTSKK
jgi:hypothetical protein